MKNLLQCIIIILPHGHLGKECSPPQSAKIEEKKALFP